MSRTNSLLLAALFCLLSAGFASAQDPPGPPPGLGHFGPPPMERAFHDRHFGRWWNDPQLAQQLGLTDQQKHAMDDIFQQHRLNLIDLNANLEKQEVLLQPMISADQPDETQVLAQIDKIAQARADLEKADARMLFSIRKTLTPEQWQKLKTMRREHRDADRMRRDFRDRGGPGGPGNWRQRRQGPPPSGGAAPPPPQSQGQPPASPQ